jgi:GTPase SAR1 family protein/tetratricopeptide (TPR) repeat protein
VVNYGVASDLLEIGKTVTFSDLVPQLVLGIGLFRLVVKGRTPMSTEDSASSDGFRAETTRALFLPKPVHPVVEYGSPPGFLIEEYRRSAKDVAEWLEKVTLPEVQDITDKALLKQMRIAAANAAPIVIGMGKVAGIGFATFRTVAAGAVWGPMALLMAPGLALVAGRLFKDLRRAFSIDPKIRKFIEQAEKLAREGDLKGAEAIIRQALEVDIDPDQPRNADLWFTLGRIHIQQNMFRKAMLDFARAAVLTKGTEPITQTGSDGKKIKITKRGYAELFVCACIDTIMNESDTGSREWAELLKETAGTSTRRLLEYSDRQEKGRLWGLIGQDPRSAEVNRSLVARVQFLSAKGELLSNPSARNYEKLHQKIQQAVTWLTSDVELTTQEQVNSLLEQVKFYRVAIEQDSIEDQEVLKAALTVVDQAAQIARKGGMEELSLKVEFMGCQMVGYVLSRPSKGDTERLASLRRELETRMSQLAQHLETATAEVPYRTPLLYSCYEKCLQLSDDQERKDAYARKMMEAVSIAEDPILHLSALQKKMEVSSSEEEHYSSTDQMKQTIENAVDKTTDPVLVAYLLQDLAKLESNPDTRRELHRITANAFNQASGAALKDGITLPFRSPNGYVAHDATVSAMILGEMGFREALLAGNLEQSKKILEDLSELSPIRDSYWEARLHEMKGLLSKEEGNLTGALEHLRKASALHSSEKRFEENARVLKELEALGAEIESGEAEDAAEHLGVEQYVELQKKVATLLHGLQGLDGEGSGGLDRAADKVLNNRFLLAVVGEFSSGKSTFINALIGADVLPTSSLPTTCVVNYLVYQEVPSCTVTFADNRKEGDIPLEKLKEYVSEDGNPDNSKEVAEVTIGYPLPMLESGVVVIDTPGVGSIVGRHSEITYDIIPHADAIVLLSNCREPYSQTEQTFLLKLREEIGDRLFVVLNKVDTIDEASVDKILAFALESISQDLDDPMLFALSSYFRLYARLIESGEIDPEELSGKRMLRGITDPSELRRLSRFDQLNDALLTYLARNKGAIVLRAGIQKAQGFILRQLTEAKAMESALHENLDVLEEKAERFAAVNQEARTKIENMLDEFVAIGEANAYELGDALNAGLPSLHDLVAQQIQSIPAENLSEADLEAIVRDQAQDWAHEHIRSASQALQYDVFNLFDRIDQENTERMQEFGKTFCQGEEIPKISDFSGDLELSRGAASMLEQPGAKYGAGAVLGVLGAVLLGPLGLIGGVIGGLVLAGWFANAKKSRLISEIRSLLPQVISPVSQEYRKRTLELMRMYRDQVGSEIQLSTEHLDKQLREMVEAKRKGEAEVVSRLKDLKSRMDKLENFEKEAVELSNMIR